MAYVKVPIETDLKYFRTHIKNLRVQFNVTQEELAKRLSISQAHVAQIESGRKVPSVSMSFKIARALNVSYSELFDFSYLSEI